MNSSRYILMTSVVLTMGLTGLPASAAGLLGGVLGGGTSGGTAGSVVTLQSGPAANNGLVNVGLGGGDGGVGWLGRSARCEHGMYRDQGKRGENREANQAAHAAQILRQ